MDAKPWAQVVRLHPDVESESTAISTYAIDLGALVMKDPNVPPKPIGMLTHFFWQPI